ncbi:low-density lipoprotein receptor-related protein 4-like [Liolophura sinensis]|uniref:low-density lipoprotein receptor-related protein 4-like n=1 Tax=Liolophura sinensis TaxID=3198878 RepID=UPI0031585B09
MLKSKLSRRTNAENITVLKKSTTQLMGIALWAEKPTVAMADVSSATECPYIWLLGHNSTTGGAFGQCYCPDGFSANYVKDQLHCDKMNETTEANTFSPANTTNSSSICTADQFNCGDGICIPALWRCDGNTECPSGLDEEDCADCVVYSTQKVIRKFCVGDTYEEELLLLDGRNHALFIDVDFRQKCVYYTDYKPIEMNRTLQVVCWNQTTMAFSSPRIIRSNFYRLEGIAYDWITGNVYTLEAGSRRLSVTTNDGRFTKVLYEGTEIFDRPRDLVVHPGLGQLFWTDWSKVNPRIVRASMSGDQSSIFILAQGKHQLGLLNGIALDIPSSKVYWAETKGKIGSVNMDGTDLSTFPAKNGGFPFSIAVSPELIYWTDWVKSEIQAVRKTNLTNLIVVKKVVKRSPIGIALWAEKPTVEISYLSLATKCPYLWLLGHNSTTGSAYGQCYCPDEFSATLVNGQRECDTMNETTEANTFAPASSFRARPEDCLLYTSRNELHRICLGNDTTSLLVKSSKVSVMDVDVDYAHRCIFYTAFNYATYSVQEFCYQRWETFTPILNSRGAPDGLAYDWAGQNIYWLESTQKALMVTDRNGRYRATLYSGHIFDRPRGLVLNPEKGDLFWADWSNTNPAIMQASMTGNPSSVKALVKTNLGWPNGLALDTKINQLYWTDGKLDKIMKFDLNGNWMREVRDLGPSSHHPFGIAVSDRFIYWSNWRSGSLLAVTKEAPNKSPIITVVKKVFSPNRLAVIPKETKAPKPCSKVCPHLCLTSYNVTTREPDHVCRCADGFLSIKDSYGHFICIGNSSTESVTTEARFPFVFATIEGKNYTVLTSTCRPLRLHRLCPVQCLIQVDFEDGKRCLKCICQ